MDFSIFSDFFTLDWERYFTIDVPYAQELKFGGVMLIPLFALILYGLLDRVTVETKQAWEKAYTKQWGMIRCRAFMIWFACLIVSFGVGLAADATASVDLMKDGQVPTAKTNGIAGVMAAFATVIYFLWWYTVSSFRDQRLKDRTRDLVQFNEWWWSKLEGIRKVVLFLLTVLFMPISRVVLEQFYCYCEEGWTAPSDDFPLECHIIRHDNQRCFPDEVSGIQIAAFIFGVVYIIGLPLFFGYLIQKGVHEMIDVHGYALAAEQTERAIKKLETDKPADYKAQIKKLTAALDKLYVDKATHNLCPQSYLFAAYERPFRYFKIGQMLQKFLIVALTLYVPTSVWANAKIVASNVVIIIFAATTILTRPFHDTVEDVMEIFSQSANGFNVFSALNLNAGWIPVAIIVILLFAFNGIAIVVFIIGFCIAPAQYLRVAYGCCQSIGGVDAAKKAAAGAVAAKNAVAGGVEMAANGAGAAAGAVAGAAAPVADAVRDGAAVGLAVGRDGVEVAGDVAGGVADGARFVADAAHDVKDAVEPVADALSPFASAVGQFAGPYAGEAFDAAGAAAQAGGGIALDGIQIGGDLAVDGARLGAAAAADGARAGAGLAVDGARVGADLAVDGARSGAGLAADGARAGAAAAADGARAGAELAAAGVAAGADAAVAGAQALPGLAADAGAAGAQLAASGAVSAAGAVVKGAQSVAGADFGAAADAAGNAMRSGAAVVQAGGAVAFDESKHALDALPPLPALGALPPLGVDLSAAAGGAARAAGRVGSVAAAGAAEAAPVLQSAAGYVAPGVDRIAGAASQVAGVASPYASQAAGAVSPYANQAVGAVSPHAQQAVNSVSPYANSALNAVSPYAQAAAGAVSPYAQSVAGAVSPYAQQAASQISPHLQSLPPLQPLASQMYGAGGALAGQAYHAGASGASLAAQYAPQYASQYGAAGANAVQSVGLAGFHSARDFDYNAAALAALNAGQSGAQFAGNAGMHYGQLGAHHAQSAAASAAPLASQYGQAGLQYSAQYGALGMQHGMAAGQHALGEAQSLGAQGLNYARSGDIKSDAVSAYHAVVGGGGGAAGAAGSGGDDLMSRIGAGMHSGASSAAQYGQSAVQYGAAHANLHDLKAGAQYAGAAASPYASQVQSVASPYASQAMNVISPHAQSGLAVARTGVNMAQPYVNAGVDQAVSAGQSALGAAAPTVQDVALSASVGAVPLASRVINFVASHTSALASVDSAGAASRVHDAHSVLSGGVNAAASHDGTVQAGVSAAQHLYQANQSQQQAVSTAQTAQNAAQFAQTAQALNAANRTQ